MIGMDSVAIVRHGDSITESIKSGLNLIGGFGDLKPRILIKPNICTISDDTGYSVTNIDLVEAVVNLLLEANREMSIKIVESFRLTGK